MFLVSFSAFSQALIETKPYELLVRWKDGILSGAQVQFIERTTTNGVVLTEKITSPQPVGAKGFPLQDILDKVSADALTALADSDAAKTDAESKLAALEPKYNDLADTVASGDAAAIAAKAAAIQAEKASEKDSERKKRIDQLTQQIAALQAELDSLGP